MEFLDLKMECLCYLSFPKLAIFNNVIVGKVLCYKSYIICQCLNRANQRESRRLHFFNCTQTMTEVSSIEDCLLRWWVEQKVNLSVNIMLIVAAYENMHSILNPVLVTELLKCLLKTFDMNWVLYPKFNQIFFSKHYHAFKQHN